jgi:hypothetical protein
MKVKFYSVLISTLLLLSVTSYAEADKKTEKSRKAKKETVAGNKLSESFSLRSSVYNRDGLVKKKRRGKNSCPSFD